MVPRMAVQSMDLHWKSPEPGFYKVNFDGALFLDQRCASFGVVVRDLAGLVIAALSQRVRLPGSVDWWRLWLLVRPFVLPRNLAFIIW